MPRQAKIPRTVNAMGVGTEEIAMESRIGKVNSAMDCSADCHVTTRRPSILGDITNMVSRTSAYGQSMGGVFSKTQMGDHCGRPAQQVANGDIRMNDVVVLNHNGYAHMGVQVGSSGLVTREEHDGDDAFVVLFELNITGVTIPELTVSRRELVRKEAVDSHSLNAGHLCLGGRPVAPQGWAVPTHSAMPQTYASAVGVMEDADVEFIVANDPQHVPQYANEIHARMYEDERRFMANSDYMDSQKEINPKMRAILVDWLVEVHMKYKQRPETLFLAINIVDRFLCHRVIQRKRLQLVSVASIMIASKFEEIYPPEIHEYVHIADNAFTKE